MKIEKLNDNKIRITLNIDDLSQRDIDLHSFMSNSIESQDVFLDMLDEADKKVGFNTDGCKLMIEALALKEGIFVLTITKFEYQTKEEKLAAPSKKKLHIKRKEPVINLKKTIYSFESFDAFCEFCTFIKKLLTKEQIMSFSKFSDLYEYNSSYYLIFTDINAGSTILKQLCSSLVEFAHFVNSSELFERKIKEYRKNNYSKFRNYNLHGKLLTYHFKCLQNARKQYIIYKYKLKMFFGGQNKRKEKNEHKNQRTPNIRKTI